MVESQERETLERNDLEEWESHLKVNILGSKVVVRVTLLITLVLRAGHASFLKILSLRAHEDKEKLSGKSILITSREEGEQDVDLKLFIKAFEEQFKALNSKLDDLQPIPGIGALLVDTIMRKKRSIHMEDIMKMKGEPRRDNYLDNNKMTISTFQGKKYPKRATQSSNSLALPFSLSKSHTHLVRKPQRVSTLWFPHFRLASLTFAQRMEPWRALMSKKVMDMVSIG
ncbi:hypothetical protein CR513_24244, partial [Mucuna pruriens]